jgi:hypothetical protein
MTTGRLEAFSDGVIAIIITIMVLEMKVPHGDGLKELAQLLPVFLSYILSFFSLGFIGTITITCCMPAPPSRVQYSGPISICFSGSPYFLSLQGGWEKTISPRCLRRFIAWCY